MSNSKYNLEERTLNFSISVLKFCSSLRNPVLLPIRDQLIRSATSIGANYAEANNAASTADFRNKIYIAKKEAAETEYWLKILLRIKNEPTIQELLAETHEILLILQAILNKTK